MKKIVIGTRIDSEMSLALDVDALIRSKALIQGNSGAGKSGLIRVIVEQIAATVPTIIIDPESEFASLREKLDMVLVGEQGELQADPRSAGLLARKLMEMGASAVLDIYELKPDAKHAFVKLFLESMMALPRKLWRPTLIVIDEAHMFAPEKGMGESVALDAVSDLLLRGRKRGYGNILATPRLSMLNKNVSGANNIFIGRTVLDVDQVRAGKTLGQSSKEAVQLRALKGRQFYCYGPALNVDGVTLFRVADCETSIPEPGIHKTLTPPKASHVVKAIADKLKDIQQEAEVEIRTLNEAKGEIARLTRELKQAKNNQLPREQDRKRIEQLTEDLKKAHEQTRTETKTIEKRIVIDKNLTRLEALRNDLDAPIGRLETILDRMREERGHVAVPFVDAKEVNAVNVAQALSPPRAIDRLKPAIRPAPQLPKLAAQPHSVVLDSEIRITPTQQRILDALAFYESIGIRQPSNVQLGAVALIDASGGYFGNVTTPLTSAGLIVRAGGHTWLADEGRRLAHAPENLATLDDYHEQLRARVRQSKNASNKTIEILNVIIAAGGVEMTSREIGETVGVDHTGGYFGNVITPLSTIGLIERRAGVVRPTDVLFPPGL